MTDIFYSTLIVFYIYSGLALLARYLLIPSYYGFARAEILWPLLFFTLLSATYLAEKKDIRQILNRDTFRRNYAFYLIFFALLLIRLININKVNLWLDEDGQSGAAIMEYPLYAGAGQQQPPLDYQLTAIAVWFPGFIVWAQRFHAAFFSALSGALLFEWVRRLLKSVWPAFILVIFYAFQFVVVQYAYEARPVSLALFTEILFLHRVCSALAFGENSNEDIFYRNKNWSLSAVTFLYLCSIGMQPVVVVGCTLAFWAAYSFFRREQLRNLWALLRGFLFFLPIQIFISMRADQYFIKREGLGILQFIREIKIENYFPVYDYFLPLGLFALFLGLAVLTVRFFWRKQTDIKILFLIFLLAVFGGLLLPLFRSRIVLYTAPRYFISVLPMIFMLLALGWKRFTDLFAKHRQLVGGILIGVLGLGAVPYYHFGPLFDLESYYMRDDLRAVYAEIKKLSPDEHRTLVLTTGLNPAAWYPTVLLNQVFYYRKIDKSLHYYFGYPSVRDYADALQAADKKIEDVYFIHYMTWSDSSLSQQNFVAAFRGLELYRLHLKPGQDLAHAVINFLEPIAQNAEKKGVFYISPVEYLLTSYFYLKDEPKWRAYVNLYKKNRKADYNSEYIEARLAPEERL